MDEFEKWKNWFDRMTFEKTSSKINVVGISNPHISTLGDECLNGNYKHGTDYSIILNNGVVSNDETPSLMVQHSDMCFIYFYKNGRIHRENGPAKLSRVGNMFEHVWFNCGFPHNLTGPSFINNYSNITLWHIHGKSYSNFYDYIKNITDENTKLELVLKYG